MVRLPSSLVPETAQQMQVARVVWQQDKQNDTPLMLPNRLAKKYPEYRFSWAWAWLFPAHHPCRDPRSGQIVRFRMHEANVQRAVKRARRRLGIMVSTAIKRLSSRAAGDLILTGGTRCSRMRITTGTFCSRWGRRW